MFDLYYIRKRRFFKDRLIDQVTLPLLYGNIKTSFSLVICITHSSLLMNSLLMNSLLMYHWFFQFGDVYHTVWWSVWWSVFGDLYDPKFQVIYLIILKRFNNLTLWVISFEYHKSLNISRTYIKELKIDIHHYLWLIFIIIR